MYMLCQISTCKNLKKAHKSSKISLVVMNNGHLSFLQILLNSMFFSYFKFLLGVNKWSGLMICQIQKLHIMRLFCNIVAYEDIKRQRQQKVVP